MQRVRRLASITVIALVGVVALAACRSEPGIAAYIGGQQITEDQVDSVVDDMSEQLKAEGEAAGADADALAAAAERLPSRNQVVSVIVLGDLCRQLQAERGFDPRSEHTADQISQGMGLPPGADYVQDVADLYTCLSGIEAGDPVTPTGEELALLVERGRQAGVIPQEVADADAATQLDGDQLRAALATRDAIAEAVADYDVTVNPRYRPLEFPVLSFQGDIAAVSVALGDPDSGTVTERR